MKVKRFTAPTMPEALKQVKATLGPEAVILETTEAPGQVTVTAAVDLDAPAGGATDPAAGGATDPADGALVSEVRELMSVVRELVDEQWRRQVPPGGRGIRRLHRALVAQGVDGVIAAALLRETAERLGPGARLDAALAGTLVTAPAAATPSVRLFFGPPGDGKTTTIAKLAAQARRAGRRVLLVGADTYRIGAAAELERYGQALGAEVRRAKDPAELGHALRDHGRADLVLIDTAGAGPAQQAELAEVKALADAAGADAGRTLVVSAATGALAAAHTWRAFAALGPDACVLTKADTAPGGPIVAQLWRERVPVSHVAAGRRIPDDLEAATPKRLVRCLLAA